MREDSIKVVKPVSRYGVMTLTTNAVDGLQTGESFQLIAWDGELEKQIILDISGNDTDLKLVYEQDEFIKLNVSRGDLIPSKYFLSNAYPNPFNSVTRFAFGLPEAPEASINVFDLSGRNIATLVSGKVAMGRHVVVWNAIDHASGVYILQMNAGGFTAVQKLAFVK